MLHLFCFFIIIFLSTLSQAPLVLQSNTSIFFYLIYLIFSHEAQVAHLVTQFKLKLGFYCRNKTRFSLRAYGCLKEMSTVAGRCVQLCPKACHWLETHHCIVYAKFEWPSLKVCREQTLCLVFVLVLFDAFLSLLNDYQHEENGQSLCF